MDIDRIAACISVLDEFSASFTLAHGSDADAARTGLALVTAQSILIEYAGYRTGGFSHDEALRLTAAKGQSLSEASESLYALLTRQTD